MPWNNVPPNGTCWRCHGEAPKGQMMCAACDAAAEEWRKLIPIDPVRRVRRSVESQMQSYDADEQTGDRRGAIS